MKIKKVLVIVALSFSIIMCPLILTFAENTSYSEVKNEFITGDLLVGIGGYADSSTNWMGKIDDRPVWINNDETSDFIVRVALISRWVDENNNPWAGDSGVVKYIYSKSLYTVNNEEIPLDNELWVKSNESNGDVQYFYYNKILKPGESTEKLLEQFYVLKEEDISKTNNNTGTYIPSIEYERYKKKKLVMDVKAEAVMVDNDAIKAAWGESTGNSQIDNMLLKLCDKK